MTKENFINLINEYSIVLTNIHKYYEFGIDLYDSKHPISPSIEKMINLIFDSIYTEEAFGWIDWFIYDNNFGTKKLEASDSNGKLICQTAGDLYDYIEKYKK